MRSDEDKIAEIRALLWRWLALRGGDPTHEVERNYMPGIKHSNLNDALALARAINRLPD